MTSRRKLKQVQRVDICSFDTRDVAEGADKVGGCTVVNDEGTKTLTMTAITHFASSSTEFSGCTDFDDIIVCIHAAEEGDRFFGLCKFDKVRVGDNKRDLEDLFDTMTTGKN